MAERVDYHVNAWLRTRGDFAKQMTRQAAAVGHASRRWETLGRHTAATGSVIMGTTAQTARGYAKVGAAVTGLAALGGFHMLLSSGTAFNEVMEETNNSIGAMFQLYKQNGGDMVKNIEQASFVQRQLFDLAKKSPVEFQDAVNIYQGAASGLIVANQSMQEQMRFMKGAQMLGAVVPDLESKVIGGQLGRILMGGAGAEFEVWKRLAPSILEAGKAAGLFAKNQRMGMDFTQKFNQLAQEQPEMAAELLKTAVRPLEDMADRFEKSWGGILSTTKSNLKLVAAAFTGPFHEMRKRVLYEMNKTGIFSEANLPKLEHIAAALGFLFSNVMERVFDKLMRWITLLRDNWEQITTTMYSVGQQVAMLIKGAFIFGVIRMSAGAAVVAAGKGIAAAGAARRGGGKALEFLGAQRRKVHTGLARGALPGGGGKGLTGFMGKFLAQVSALSTRGRGAMRFMVSMGSLVATMAAAATAVVILGTGLAAVAVIAGGIAAYVISQWDAIAASIIQGLESGRISLVPFLVALYTLYERLKAVGRAFLGGTDGATMFTGAMNWAITAFNWLGGAISFVMQVIGVSIGIWGALRLALQGVMWVILKMIELIAEIPGALDDETVERARRNYNQFAQDTVDVFTKADQLMTAADRIAEIDVKALDMDKINKQADDWKKKIVEGLRDEDKKRKKPKGPTVHVGQVVINQDLRDTDPDRLWGSFVVPMQRLADQRVQAYDQLDEGE